MRRMEAFAHSFRESFEGTVTLRHISSGLRSFDRQTPAGEVRSWLERLDFDEVGVRENGVVTGYARTQDMIDDSWPLGEYLRGFEPEDVVSMDFPLLEALELIRTRKRIYLSVLGEVNGIATSGDVLKPPVRLWLFGLIMILEMHMTRLIKRGLPEGQWQQFLSAKQIAKARYFHKEAPASENVTLEDRLSFGDKTEIVAKCDSLRTAFGLGGPEETRSRLLHIKGLRDALAHFHDISHKWPAFLDTAAATNELIGRIDKIKGRDLIILA